MRELGQTSDFGRSRAWPDTVASSLDLYRQGHIIDGVPVLFLAGTQPLWAQDRLQLAEAAGVPVIVEDPPSLRRAMVVSQGCDLVKRNAPWATVVPVYDAGNSLDDSQKAAARSGATVHLVHLTASWTGEGFWVADLRLELPVEKTLLARLEPQDAFADETEYALLAERLGAQRARPAVPDPCLEHVVGPLFDLIRQCRVDGTDPYAGVRELRVQCNDPINPTVVTLFVVTRDDEQADASEWHGILESLHQHSADHGITMVGPEIASLWDMSARDYVTSALVTDQRSS